MDKIEHDLDLADKAKVTVCKTSYHFKTPVKNGL